MSHTKKHAKGTVASMKVCDGRDLTEVTSALVPKGGDSLRHLAGRLGQSPGAWKERREVALSGFRQESAGHR